MPKIADRVKETTTTTGTGTYSLGGAATGFRAFSSAFATGDTVYYCAENGTDWEVGVGTLTTGSPWTLARTTILASSNAGAAVNWSAGTRNVYCAFPAAPAALAASENHVINGGCEVSLTAPATLSTSYQVGAVEMFGIKGAGTAVSAGSITQDSAASIGSTGYALHASGVTITGTGIVYAAYRQEALLARRLKNKTASVAVTVHHDVGSSINYTIKISKAGSADVWSSPTTITTGSATSVATGTETRLKLEGIALGDCSNGLEIEVKAECGAVTTKNFRFADWKLEQCPVATEFVPADAANEKRRCLRYCETEPTRGNTVSMHYNGINSYFGVTFTVEKRVTPTVSLSATVYNKSGGGSSSGGTLSAGRDSVRGFEGYVASGSFTAGEAGECYYTYTATARLF